MVRELNQKSITIKLFGKFPNIQKLNNILLNDHRLKMKSQNKLESILNEIKIKQQNIQDAIKAVQSDGKFQF